MPSDASLTSALAGVRSSTQRAAARRGLAETPEWAAVAAALVAAGTLDAADGWSCPELDGLASRFRLDDDARRLLLVVAAGDLDPIVARAYGALSGRRGTQPVTVGLALELCSIPSVGRRARAALGPDGALRRWLLIDEHDDDELWLERPLNASADVLDALLGQVATVPRWDLPLAADGPDASDLTGLDSLHQASAEIAAALVAGSSLTWVLDGAPGSAGSAAALLGYRSAGIACAIVRLRLRPADSGVVAALLQTISWAGCRGLGLVVVPGDPLTGSGQAESVARLLFASPVPVVVVSRDRWDPRWYSDVPIVVPAGPLSPDDRLALWQRYLGDAVADDSVRSFPLDPEQIHAAAREVTARRQLGDARPLVDQIGAAVRAVAGSRQPGHADARLPLSLADLQLEPLAQAELVRMCGWVAHRDDVVTGTELFADGIGASGLCALFSGRPGTGKTMAAQVVADVAGLDLLRVNLATVVDKYIGETEKNLERIFAEAEQANVVVFFDEADALFGNRSAVNDARDRYANQEVAYLLQRMERFAGISILATNMRGNIDPAFSRRIQFVIHFVDPDLPTRQRLWSRFLGLGPAADPADIPDPTGFDALELTGGEIRNIVVSASFDAAIDATGIGQRHLLAAARREFVKLGRRLPAELSRTEP